MNIVAIAAINRRPGKAWHVLQFAPTRIVVATLAMVGFAIAMQVCASAMHIRPGTVLGFGVAAVSILGICGVYSAYVHLVEQRSVIELDRRGAVRGFGLGLLVGSGLFCVTVLILWLLGVWQINGVNSWTTLLYTLAGALVAAFTEEIVVRSVFFRIVEESLGSWLALALSAALFGLLHGLNPGATIISSMAIALEAGFLLAAAYMYARRLWLVIGLHFAWNFTEGGIFGASVSGGSGAHGLLTSELHGSDILTGGRFGPEASVVAVLVCLAAGCVFLVLARRSGHIVAPAWRRRSGP
jgi:membrane protease YdiL (CAAX protease family)